MDLVPNHSNGKLRLTVSTWQERVTETIGARRSNRQAISPGLQCFGKSKAAGGAVGTICRHNEFLARRSGRAQPPWRRTCAAPERRRCTVRATISEAHRAHHWARRDSCASSRSPATAPGQQRPAPRVPTAPHARREEPKYRETWSRRSTIRAASRSLSRMSGPTIFGSRSKAATKQLARSRTRIGRVYTPVSD
jgi:hypothetical protein